MSLLPATLAGIRLDFQGDLSEDRKGAVVRHEYPGQHGADVEFLGWNTPEHKLKTVFLADRQDEWIRLQRVLETGVQMTLEHPVKGTLHGYVETLLIKIDDRIDTVEIDLTFVEDGVNVATVFRPSAADVAASVRPALLSRAPAEIAKEFYPWGVPYVDLSDPFSWARLGDLGNVINALVGGMKAQIGRIDSLIATFTSPVSALFGAIEWASDLPSQLSKRIATVLDLMQGKVDGAPSPALSVHKFLSDGRRFTDSFAGTAVEGAARILLASQAALSVARVMANDETRLRAMRAFEATTSFDSEGRLLVSSSAMPQLPATAPQIESVVTAARVLIQEARPWVDDPADLDRLALALQESYRSRLVEFERLREIVVLKPTPLHIICHQYGLAYNVAERLVLLNRIRNPSFVQGKILIYAT